MRPGRMGTHCRHVAGADLILERLAFGLGALGRIYLERSAVFQLVQLPLLLISRLSANLPIFIRLGPLIG